MQVTSDLYLQAETHNVRNEETGKGQSNISVQTFELTGYICVYVVMERAYMRHIMHVGQIKNFTYRLDC